VLVLLPAGDRGGDRGEDLVDRGVGAQHVAQAHGGGLGLLAGAQPDHRGTAEHRRDGVAAEPSHGEVHEDHVPDARGDDREGLGEVRAAAHDARGAGAVHREVVDDADLVAARGAQDDVDHGVTPWAPGTPITSRRSSWERTSSPAAMSSAGTWTSAAIERMPRQLPSRLLRTTA